MTTHYTRSAASGRRRGHAMYGADEGAFAATDHPVTDLVTHAATHFMTPIGDGTCLIETIV
jgi:hypothetical protein